MRVGISYRCSFLCVDIGENDTIILLLFDCS